MFTVSEVTKTLESIVCKRSHSQFEYILRLLSMETTSTKAKLSENNKVYKIVFNL